METRLLRKTHSAQKVLETWVRAKGVNPKIGLEKVRDVGGSLLVGLFQKFECFFLVAESGVYRRNHVGRHIRFWIVSTSHRVSSPLQLYCPSPHRRVPVQQ